MSASQPLAPTTPQANDVPTLAPDQLEIITQVGAGSFGRVFKVKHKETGQIYALKKLDRKKFEQAKLMKYAASERNILAMARHPYRVRLHYSFDTETHIGLVMTYCPRGDMQKLLKRHVANGMYLSVERIRLYTAELLLALEYLHEHKILYRDFKPANIILDQEWHALLTDFGLSKEVAEGVAKTLVGSLAFMAPEILARKGHNHTVDIYGLGVIVYTMFDANGMPPFFTPNAEELKKKIRQTALVVPANVPEDAGLFITETMKRIPSQRPGAARTADARGHVFFTGVDFEAVMRREVPVPDAELLPAARSEDDLTKRKPAGCRRWNCFN